MKHIQILLLTGILSACQIIQAKLPEQQVPRESLDDYIERITREQRRLAAERHQQHQAEQILAQQRARELLELEAQAFLTFNQHLEGLNQNGRPNINEMRMLLTLFPDLIRDRTLLAPDGLIYTYLMYALAQRNSALAQLLIPYSNLGQQTDNFASFLDCLVQQNFDPEQDAEFLFALSNLLDTINPNIMGRLLERTNNRGNTPLIQAIRHQNKILAGEFFIMLLALGADIDAPNRYGVAPIFVAIQEENVPVIGELIRNRVDLQTRNAHGETANSLLFDELRDQVNDYIAILDASDSESDLCENPSDADDEYSTDSDSE